MKYLKAFKTQSDYIDFKTDGSDWVVPSVYFIKDNKEIVFNPKVVDTHICFAASDFIFYAADAQFYALR